MVPLFAGVIIAGLGIGALLSAFAARHVPAPKRTTSSVVTQTPTPLPSVAQITATPQRTQAPSATPKPSPSPSSSPSANVTPTPSPEQTRKPKAAAPASAAASLTAAPTPAPTATAIATPHPTLAVRTPSPTFAPSAAPVVAQASPAEALVRKFLEAVAHGDDTTAYSTLGGAATPLGEAQFLDPTMRITSMSSGRAPGGGTNVQVEFRTSRGEYFGTFVVNGSGSEIVQREVIPVGGTTAR